MNETYALATVTSSGGEVVVHRADCPEVHKFADDGYETHSLFGCREPIMPGLRRHDCLGKFGPGPVVKQEDVGKQPLSKIKRFTASRRLNGAKTGEIPIENICEGVTFADGRVAVHWHKSGEIDIWPSLEKLYEEIGGPEFGGDMFWDDI